MQARLNCDVVGVACLQSLPRVCILSLAAFLASCGSVTNPKDVDVTKLKPPMNLQAVAGDKSITLRWTANNDESDFSGFNIYVSTDDAAKVTSAFSLTADSSNPQRFTPITTRNEKEDEVDGVRANLAKYFNYVKEAAGSKDPGDSKTFSPLVRCNVSANDTGGACAEATDANTKNRANGIVEYTVKSLDPAKQYTFFVTSTLDSGKKIVSPTSNIVVVSPHVVQSLSTDSTFAAPATALTGLNLAGATIASGTFNATASKTSGGAYCIPADTDTSGKTLHFYFEKLDNATVPAITPANGTRIVDLGNVKLAKDSTAVTSNLLENTDRLDGTGLVPAPEAAPSTVVPAATDIGSKAGYSVCGRSLMLFPYHLYAIAFPDGSKWRYALLETSSDVSKPETFKIVVGKAGERHL